MTISAKPPTFCPPEYLINSIKRKRSGLTLTCEEVQKIITDFLAGEVADYQMSAWLATLATAGIDIQETEFLTRAYVNSGKQIDLSNIPGPVIDKHSTGGVGDKVSLIVVPLVASCGVTVFKLSGRGLGYAGGTIDKLESIPGLKLNLSASEACFIARQVGMIITAQSSELAPGDEATYKLRDVTGAVENISLIAASIISKKVTVGADALLLDVKTGLGALIQEQKEAYKLADTMIKLAKQFGINANAVLSDMSQPLGYAVGNIIEVKEALVVLRGGVIPRLTELCQELAKQMLCLADPSLPEVAAEQKIKKALQTGADYEQFQRWLSAQGADLSYIKNPEKFPSAKNRVQIKSPLSGWLQEVNPRMIGMAGLCVGAGRVKESAQLDHTAGVMLYYQIGDKVKTGEVLAELYYNNGDANRAVNLIRSAFIISETANAARPIIHGHIK